MKPKSPFTQSFDQLPDILPLYLIENAMLPGGQLPLELATKEELALFREALRTDQLIGIAQPRSTSADDMYRTGCAGRIRQYRERSDGKLNIMLNGVCRYRIDDVSQHDDGYRIVCVDWDGFENDYETAVVDQESIKHFETTLRHYFDTHNMQIDWQALGKLHIEEAINNLVLVLSLDVESKQQLLESRSCSDRIELFSTILEQQPAPIRAAAPEGGSIN